MGREVNPRVSTMDAYMIMSRVTLFLALVPFNAY